MEIQKSKNIYVLCFVKDMGVVVEVQGLNIGSGSGNVITSGNLGEMAKDSVNICKTLLKLRSKTFSKYDYHIHFQYLNLKKDGPSWGLACFLLLCNLSGIKTKYDQKDPLAATGEIDLLGNIKPVNYMKEKIEGIAKFAECKTLIIPKIEGELMEIKKKVYQVENIKEILI